MTPESLITVFGLAVAVIALLPQERSRDIRVRLRRFDWAVIVLALLLVHYILFLPVLENLGLYVPLGPWRWGFTAETTSYAILFVATVFLWLRASRATLSRRTIPLFARLTEDLANQRTYDHLLFLLEANFGAFVRAYSNDYLSQKLRAHLLSYDNPFRNLRLHEVDRERRKRWAASRKLLIGLIPEYGQSREAARSIARRIFTDPRFVRAVAAGRPYFGLQILSSSIEERFEFQLLWFRALLHDKSSILYSEIRNNQNLRGEHRFQFPAENRLLCYYFTRAQSAEDLRLGQALDDYFHRTLTKQLRLGASDRYNHPRDRFVHQEYCENDLETVLHLFEFMVSEGLYQDVRWHMEIFSLSRFAQRILTAIRPAAEVDLEQEWPTPYHRLVYRIVSILVGMLGASADVPPDQANRRIGQMNLALENDNIPKSVILVLGCVVHDTLSCKTLDDRFKRYILSVVLRFLEESRGQESIRDIHSLLLQSIARGGLRRADRQTYRAILERTLQDIDPVRFDEIGQEILGLA